MTLVMAGILLALVTWSPVGTRPAELRDIFYVTIVLGVGIGLDLLTIYNQRASR